MRNDSLIFDLDGTLWDTTGPCAQAWNEAIEGLKLKLPHITPSQFATIMGKTFEQCVAILYPGLAPQERERVGKECLSQEIQTIRQAGASFYPGVLEGLPKLSEKYHLFVVSNCMEDYMQLFFEISGLQMCLKDWECYGRTMRPKNHNIMSVVQRNQLKAPLYIGDTASDRRAADAAGVPYWHVNYGFGGRLDCRAFDDFDELVNYFLHQ